MASEGCLLCHDVCVPVILELKLSTGNLCLLSDGTSGGGGGGGGGGGANFHDMASSCAKMLALGLDKVDAGSHTAILE